MHYFCNRKKPHRIWVFYSSCI